MSVEDNKPEVGTNEPNLGTESVQETPQFTETEQEALSHGWRPESEFDGSSGKKFKSAEQFMELKPLYDKIDVQHKELKNVRRGLEEFGKHYKKMETVAYNKALTDLKASRTQALEEGDLVKAEAVRDQIQEFKEQQAQAPAAIVPPQDLSVEMKSWRSRNDWYDKDVDLTTYADGLGNKLLNKGANPAEILAEVERKTREAFPHKFRNPNKDGAPRVESGNKKGNSGGFQLTTDETRIMENMIRAGAPITREQYAADVKKSRG